MCVCLFPFRSGSDEQLTLKKELLQEISDLQQDGPAIIKMRKENAAKEKSSGTAAAKDIRMVAMKTVKGKSISGTIEYSQVA